jgi:ADP-ribosylglycohydrolase
MPAPPRIDYVFCPDGTTAIGDNCGSSVPLYEQERIALAKIQSDPIRQAAVEAERPKMADDPQPETILGNGLTNGQKWAWVIGLTLAAYGLIYWSQKQPNK